jgi:thioredoxin 1
VSPTIVTLSDSNFDEEVKSSEEAVLVDFWAEWCGPCKMVAPILEEIATEQEGKLRIGKLNIDENLETARRFEVMSIPTLILFRDGEPLLRIIGAKGKGQLLQELQSVL